MGTVAQAAKDRPKIKKRKFKDPVYNSKFYQRLIRLEQSGAIDKLPSLDKTETEGKLGRVIGPPVAKVRKFFEEHDIGP